MLKFIFARRWRRSVAWHGAINLSVWRNFCFQNQQNSERVCSRQRRYRWPASTSRQVVAVAATSHKYFVNRSLSSFVFPASRFRPLWLCSLRFPFGKWYLRDFPRFRSIGCIPPWFWVGEGDADKSIGLLLLQLKVILDSIFYSQQGLGWVPAVKMNWKFRFWVLRRFLLIFLWINWNFSSTSL